MLDVLSNADMAAFAAPAPADASHLLTSHSAALDATLASLRESASNLEEATRTLRNYPSLLLLGEPPPRFQPPKRSE
jgi:hypothetical protein